MRILFLATALLAPVLAQGKTIFVEPFATKDGSEQIRTELIGELRRNPSLTVTLEASKADLILGGGGEVWVRGYRSLNPRTGRIGNTGTPVFSGYLSVELRDKSGETLWGYIVTPGADADDAVTDLARQISKRVADAVAHDLESPAPSASTTARTTLHGAGATFPQPLYSKWFTNYRRVNPNLEVTYEAVGSEAGIRKLISGEVDFGASDNPNAADDMAPARKGSWLALPTAAGAVTPIVNIPGIGGQISFTPELLAAIYLGKITKWNDPAIARVNPRLHLPDIAIVPVHRAEGSGTSYVWTDYLSKTSPEWKTQVGAALAPVWPVGRSAAGNEGVAETVKEIGGSIGYVEFIFAIRNHLNFGRVRNQAGEYVAASIESIAAAVRNSVAASTDLRASIVDAPGNGSYPISSFSWLVAPAHIADETKRSALTALVKWMIGPGQLQAAALGYLQLPKELIARDEQAIKALY